MKSNKLITYIIVFLLLVVLALCIYHLFNKDKELSFYGVVNESYSNGALITPYKEDKILDQYDKVNINVGGLIEGQVIKVKCNDEFLETYPVSINIIDFEIVKDVETLVETEPVIEDFDIDDDFDVEEEYEKEVTTKKTTTKKIKTTTTTTTKKIITTTQVIDKNDDIVINLLNDNIQNEEKKPLKERAKNAFINVVDFIFYDKDIKGVYYKDLTDSAKLKVISLGLKLDNTIEKKFPNYKEELSSKYQNAKGRMVALYLDKTTEFCSKKSDVCEEGKSNFQEMKKDFGLTFDIVKNATNVGWSKLKAWYEVYSGKQN